MSSPVLVTKLFIPQPRPELVHRPRLLGQLNQGLHRKLTLISAPAGFGKTTVVTDWIGYLQRESRPEKPTKFAWYALDDGDNDPNRFLAYLITALVQIYGPGPIGAVSLSMLESPQPPPVETVLIPLINEIATLPDEIIFVLDDYHLIESQPIHEALTYLLENLPPQLHLVITTREDPPIQISRWRAGGQLTEIRAVDLRFTRTETADFLNRVMGLNLPQEDIAVLEARTEGWIVGLQLAGISMQGQKDASQFINSFSGSNRFVLEYLLEEILDRQPQQIRDFLLQTAVIDRLSGSLCDALTGQEGGQHTLETLERANLFLVPLDNERRWYRYHHLFGDLLFQRLRQTQAGRIPVLHSKAGEWFTRHGMKREAIKHALAAGEFKKASELIESIAIDIMQQGEHTSVVGWINQIPEELIKEKPFLCVLHAWTLLLSGQMETAESRLLEAENALEIQRQNDLQRDDTIVRGLIHTNRAYLAFLNGQHDRTIIYAQKALRELPENAALFRVQTGIYLGVAYRYRGQLQAAFDTYNEILPIAQQKGGKIAIQCSQNMGDLLWQMTKLKQAQEVLDKALQICKQHSGRTEMPYCGFVYVLKGRILHQRAELSAAYELIKKGFDLCQEENLPEILALSHIELANICWALGNHDQARESYREAAHIFSGFSTWGRKYAAAYQAKFEIAIGNIEAAESWAQSNDLATDGDFEFHREIEYFTLVRLRIAQRNLEGAHALAEKIYTMGQDTGNKRAELESIILLSLIVYHQGDVDWALEYLGKAFTITRREGYIRIFVDEGPLMARLLYEALSSEIAPGYVRKLLAAFPVAEAQKVPENQPAASDPYWIEPLSKREIEVLRLIADGLSRQEIATRLVISLNTIKTHTRNIYGKLGVNNQMQAVGKAQGLGLLEKR